MDSSIEKMQSQGKKLHELGQKIINQSFSMAIERIDNVIKELDKRKQEYKDALDLF